nr:hypothetical protein [Tanacetum cinerariifolium]
MWITLAHCIKDAAKDFVGVTWESSRTHSSHGESWWFGEEVQFKIAAKQARFRELLLCCEGNQEDRAMAKERYKVAKREAKTAVAQAKDKANEDLYKKLDSKEGANDIYRIAKARERRRGDLGSIGGIKLIGHTMKLFERVIERRLRRETRVSENQFGFMPGRSTTEAIHLLRNLMEKYKERQRDLHMAFLDMEKAYDSVPSISSYLFALILDELSQGIQENIPWSMIFADDIVLVTESADGLNMRLESWRKVLEDNGLWVQGDEVKYLVNVKFWKQGLSIMKNVHRSLAVVYRDRIKVEPQKCPNGLVLADHESSCKQGGSGIIENVAVDLCTLSLAKGLPGSSLSSFGLPESRGMISLHSTSTIPCSGEIGYVVVVVVVDG